MCYSKTDLNPGEPSQSVLPLHDFYFPRLKSGRKDTKFIEKTEKGNVKLYIQKDLFSRFDL